jgi:hypothetical protein
MKMEKKQITIDSYNRTWSDAKKEDHGNGSAVATVREDEQRGIISIELGQYYSKYGTFKMEITQPLDRAIRVFIAAMIEDEVMEKRESPRAAP